MGVGHGKMRGKDPFTDWENWEEKSIVVRLAYECAAIPFFAFGHHWLFDHTLLVVRWAQRLEKDHRHEAMVAAWLHDIGRIKDDERHAKVGAEWAERWLREKGAPEESIRLIIDGIRNHGTSAKPETPVGHSLRLADALSIWDAPFVLRLLLEGEKKEKVSRMLEKKWRVIEEYGVEDLVDKRSVQKLFR